MSNITVAPTAFKHALGNYDWFNSASPLALAMDFKVCLGAGILYALACLTYIIFFQQPPPAERPKGKRSVSIPEVLHYAALAVISLIMFLGMGSSFLDVCLTRGFDVCLDVGKTHSGIDLTAGTTGFWFMVFSASKFYELVDTYFLAKKKQPVILLHWWHHATVPLLCAVHYYEKSSSAMTGSIFNCFVHVFMYFHFAVSSCGSKATYMFRPLITQLQLLQFATVIGHITMLVLTPPGFERYPMTYAACYTIYSSYFLLFIKFYFDSYKTPKTKKISPKAE